MSKSRRKLVGVLGAVAGAAALVGGIAFATGLVGNAPASGKQSEDALAGFTAPTPAAAADELRVIADETGKFTQFLMDDPLKGRKVNSMGERDFSGAQSGPDQGLLMDVGSYTNEHPDLFGGAAFLPDYSAMEIYYREGSGAEKDPGLLKILAGSPDADFIHLVPVLLSWDEQNALFNRVYPVLKDAPEVQGYSIEPLLGTLEIDVDGTQVTEQSLRALMTSVRSTFPPGIPAPVFRILSGQLDFHEQSGA